LLTSPYTGYPEREWSAITTQLIDEFPLSSEVIISTVEEAWKDLYSSSFGDFRLQIGRDIFLPAQAIGVILERLIAVRLAHQNSGWRGGQTKSEKDIVCTFNDRYSFEIKTSSSKNSFYGNRSTGYRSDNRLKSRTGYYLIINYKLPKEDNLERKIWKIRFGWIDDQDWVGQNKPTGQQASIASKIAGLKLVTIKSSQ